MFVDGFFNGDPHPGNLLVHETTHQPVLLDFGLTKKLNPNVCIGMAKLLIAAQENDFPTLSEVCVLNPTCRYLFDSSMALSQRCGADTLHLLYMLI